MGSTLTQLGGAHVTATSIITNPDTDPHDYEPTPKDGTIIAKSQLFVDNGIGYDSWASKTLAASPNDARTVITVGTFMGIPDGGNPHRWYSPSNVKTVADAITADLKKAGPEQCCVLRSTEQEVPDHRPGDVQRTDQRDHDEVRRNCRRGQ